MWPFKKKEPMSEEEISRVADRMLKMQNLKQYKEPVQKPALVGQNIETQTGDMSGIDSFAKQIERIEYLYENVLHPEMFDEDADDEQQNPAAMAQDPYVQMILDFASKQPTAQNNPNTHNTTPAQVQLPPSNPVFVNMAKGKLPKIVREKIANGEITKEEWIANTIALYDDLRGTQ